MRESSICFRGQQKKRALIWGIDNDDTPRDGELRHLSTTVLGLKKISFIACLFFY